ncbi:hypothetical protein C0Q70_14009 [Pomacea canaliculata]|uniref:DOMON domain-containing protein n=1 Tax=Pomacea canaliculata TaxID=400727 RepID=A0A2T7NYT6_POMCA|nr:hypothetical protein C0Q70_14009 [Pomacea canaliculata]
MFTFSFSLRPADVRQMKIRIPPTRVPAKETTYMCAYVDFENVTTDFHVIANTPIINNSYVMHHMTLMGCPNGYEDPEQALHQPFECYMGSCVDILAVWTLGMNGQCFHRDAGFKVGANSYKRLRIEYHWNNPMRQSDFVDSSGFTLYYTPHLRRHNMGMLVVGQEYLEIPPFTDLTVASSDCTATCTKNLLKSDIYVTSAFNHMHYLGKSMLMEHHRGSQMLRYITKDLAYDYNTPVIHSFSDPLVIQPGDTIRTTCHFKSSDKSVTTFQGENTSDEMCYGFITYFPVESVPGKACLSPWKGYMDCDPSTQFGCSSQERKKFSGQQLNNTNLFRDITSVCKPVSKCTEECKSAIKAAMAREPCMQTQDGRDFVESLMLRHSTGRMLMDYLLPCQLSIYKDGQKADGEACTEAVVDETSGGETPEMTLILLAFLVPVSCLWSWS